MTLCWAIADRRGPDIRSFLQVIDYLLAALCLPSFGYIGQLKEGAWFILFFSRGIAGLLGNYKVSLQLPSCNNGLVS